MSLPLSPGPCSCPAVGRGNRTKTTPKSTKQRLGRAVHALPRGEEAGAGSRSSHSSLSRDRRAPHGAPWTRPWDSAEGTPQGFTSFRQNRLPGELSQNLPQGMGRQGERWVTVSCWQIFLLIKKKNPKNQSKAPKKHNRRKLFWQRNRRFGYVTETASATVSLLQVYELIHQQQRPGYVGKTGLRASTVVSRMPT